jgi:hypothetical protein
LDDTTTLPPTIPSPRRQSTTTRVVGRALERVARCRCGGPPSVVVLRGFDGESRRRAAQVLRRLRTKQIGLDISVEPAPVVAAFGVGERHHCAVVDATGRDTQAALIAWTWRANQPERGRLAVAVDDRREVLLDPGQGLDVSPGRDQLEVVTVDDPVDGHLRAEACVVEVRQVEGLHLLHRDEVLVDDAPSCVRITLDDSGLARRAR